MYDKMLKVRNKKTAKLMAAFAISMALVCSLIMPAFALDFANNGFYFNGVQVNGGTIYTGVPNTPTNTGGYFADTITNVPTSNVTFKLTSLYTLFPLAPSYDYDEQNFSESVLNKDLVIIRKVIDGSTVPVTVSNTNDCSAIPYTGSDAYINIVPNQTLVSGTDYQLVVKRYFTKVNRYRSLTGGVTADVVINFTTAQ